MSALVPIAPTWARSAAEHHEEEQLTFSESIADDIAGFGCGNGGQKLLENPRGGKRGGTGGSSEEGEKKGEALTRPKAMEEGGGQYGAGRFCRLGLQFVPRTRMELARAGTAWIAFGAVSCVLLIRIIS